MKIINLRTDKDTKFDHVIAFMHGLCVFETTDGRADFAYLEDLLIIQED